MFRVQGDLSNLKRLKFAPEVLLAKVNAKGETGLWFACRKGKMKCARYLHGLGGSLAHRVAAYRNYSCLDIAAQHGHTQIYMWIRATQQDVPIDYAPCRYEGDCPHAPIGLYLPANLGCIDHALLYQSVLARTLCLLDNEARTALCIAINANHASIVEHELYHYQCSTTPTYFFYLACYRGNDDVVSLLLGHGLARPSPPQVSECHEQGLGFAASNGHLNTLKLLYSSRVASSAQNEQTGYPLHAAASAGHVQVVDYLLYTQSLDPQVLDDNARTPLMCLVKNAPEELDDATWETFVLLCTQMKASGKPHAFEASAKPCRNTVLLIAIRRGQYKVVQYLVEVCLVRSDILDYRGFTVLHAAIEKGHLEIASYFYQRGTVDINRVAASCGTLLHLAARNCDLKAMRFLVESCGAHTDVYTYEGDTVAHRLAMFKTGSVDCLEYLLKANPALIEARNNKGQTFLIVAVRVDNVSVLSWVRDTFPTQFAAFLRDTSGRQEDAGTVGVLTQAVRYRAITVFCMLVTYAYRYKLRVGDKRPYLIETFTQRGFEAGSNACLNLHAYTDSLSEATRFANILMTVVLRPTLGYPYIAKSTPLDEIHKEQKRAAARTRRLLIQMDMSRHNSLALLFSRILPNGVVYHMLSYDNDPVVEKIADAFAVQKKLQKQVQ